MSASHSMQPVQMTTVEDTSIFTRQSSEKLSEHATGSKHDRQPIDPQLQQFIRNTFWPDRKTMDKPLTEYASYFEYVQQVIGVARYPENPETSDGHAIKTYRDMAMFVTYLKEKEKQGNTGNTRQQLKDKLQQENKTWTEHQISISLDLTVRLWLTLFVCNDPSVIRLSNTTPLEWENDKSLQSMVQQWFPSSADSLSATPLPIDPAFTVVNLMKLRRIAIGWTNNLKDHLRYDRSNAMLYIYPHKVCLISHLETTDIFPENFILETLETLELLFPSTDGATQHYLNKNGRQIYQLYFNHTDKKDFGEFCFWRKRLVDLHTEFREPPRTVVQGLHDRRNPIQWWTFWLAVAIAVLTVGNIVVASYAAGRQDTIGHDASRLLEDANRLLASQLCYLANSSDPAICHENMTKGR